jgi:uncharacterized protein
MISTDNYSTGCKLCQQGKWLCIFLTHLCDAGCKFCPSPHKDDRICSTFGSDHNEILEHVKYQDYAGISFSGGDPFIVFDRLSEWLRMFKNELPHFYFWIYSSGLYVDEKKIKILAANGLNEIRYNIAAMNYNSGNILKTLELSKKYIEFVTVEIPSIPEDHKKITEILQVLDNIGIDYLNLHEYILVPTILSQCFQESLTYRLNHEIDLNYHAQSQRNTEKIIQYVKGNGLKIKINNCSLLKKENQMKMRRLKMGELSINEFETLTNEGFLVSYACMPVKIEIKHLKDYFSVDDPEVFDNYIIKAQDVKKCLEKDTSTLLKLTYLPPMDLKSKRKLIDFKRVSL